MRFPRPGIQARRLIKGVGLFVATASAAAVIAACSAGGPANNSGYAGDGSDVTTVSYQMQDPGYVGPEYGTDFAILPGHFCIWVSSPLECMFTTYPRIGLMDLENPYGYHGTYGQPVLAALFTYYLMYHSWFNSSGYYNHYIVNNTYITTGRSGLETQYRNRVSYADSHYHADETRYEKKSEFTSRAMFKDPKHPNAKAVPVSTVVRNHGVITNNGGSRTTRLCAFRSGDKPVQARLAAYHSKPPKVKKTSKAQPVASSTGGGGSTPPPTVRSTPRVSPTSRSTANAGGGRNSGGHASYNQLPCG